MASDYTPLKQVAIDSPMERENILKVSLKWTSRTKQDKFPWPKDGSLDLRTLIQLEGKILDYKNHDKSPKRADKRKNELGVLALFLQLARKTNNDFGSDTSVQSNPSVTGSIDIKPPPYSDSNAEPSPVPKGLYPQVEFSGSAEIPD